MWIFVIFLFLSFFFFFNFVDFQNFFKLLRLLLNVTKVTTEHRNWPKMSQNSLISPFLPEVEKSIYRSRDRLGKREIGYCLGKKCIIFKDMIPFLMNAYMRRSKPFTYWRFNLNFLQHQIVFQNLLSKPKTSLGEKLQRKVVLKALNMLYSSKISNIIQLSENQYKYF